MKKSAKAALFSLLIFPGVGHFYLRRWIPGALFLLPAFASVVFLLTWSVEQAFATVDQVLAGEIQPDAASIQKALEQPPPERTALLLDGAKWLILASWLGAAIDAARLGHKLDTPPPAK
ncbi:MAG: hypothetical protein ACP5I4_09345 [Oceanipulchritudo sp.]